MSLAKAVGFPLSGVIFFLSFATLSMWVYMLNINSGKAREMQMHSDSLPQESDDPNTEGAQLFTK